MDQAHDRPEHVNQARITGVSITPVAFKDPPLLNTVGVHEPFALRAIVELLTDAGVSGFGETYGDAGHLARLRLAAAALNGTDIFNINELRSRIARALQQDTIQGGHGSARAIRLRSSLMLNMSVPFRAAAQAGAGRGGRCKKKPGSPGVRQELHDGPQRRTVRERRPCSGAAGP